MSHPHQGVEVSERVAAVIRALSRTAAGMEAGLGGGGEGDGDGVMMMTSDASDGGSAEGRVAAAEAFAASLDDDDATAAGEKEITPEMRAYMMRAYDLTRFGRFVLDDFRGPQGPRGLSGSNGAAAPVSGAAVVERTLGSTATVHAETAAPSKADMFMDTGSLYKFGAAWLDPSSKFLVTAAHLVVPTSTLTQNTVSNGTLMPSGKRVTANHVHPDNYNYADEVVCKDVVGNDIYLEYNNNNHGGCLTDTDGEVFVPDGKDYAGIAGEARVIVEIKHAEKGIIFVPFDVAAIDPVSGMAALVPTDDEIDIAEDLGLSPTVLAGVPMVGSRAWIVGGPSGTLGAVEGSIAAQRWTGGANGVASVGNVLISSTAPVNMAGAPIVDETGGVIGMHVHAVGSDVGVVSAVGGPNSSVLAIVLERFEQAIDDVDAATAASAAASASASATAAQPRPRRKVATVRKFCLGVAMLEMSAQRRSEMLLMGADIKNTLVITQVDRYNGNNNNNNGSDEHSSAAALYASYVASNGVAEPDIAVTYASGISAVPRVFTIDNGKTILEPSVLPANRDFTLESRERRYGFSGDNDTLAIVRLA